MKACIKCGETKLLDEFAKRKSARDGRRNECCACFYRIYSASWIKKNRTRANELARAYAARHKLEIAARVKARRDANPEPSRQSFRKWYALNKDKSRAATQAWIARHPGWYRDYAARNAEAIRSNRSAWARANRGLVAAKTRRHQAAKLRACPKWLSAIQVAQISGFYEAAHARSVQTGIPHTVDHIVPLQGREVRGLHVPWNLRVIPAKENLSKGNRLTEVGHG